MGHMEGGEGIASDPGRSRIHQLTVKILNEGFARARRHWHRCLGSPSCFGVSLGRSRLWSEVSHQDEREVRGQQAPQARHILSQSGDLNRCRVLKWGHQELGYISYWSHNIWDTGSSFSSVQFSSVAQSCPTLCNPMNRSTPGLPVHHQLPELTQTHVHRVSDAILEHLILRRILSSPSCTPER